MLSGAKHLTASSAFCIVAFDVEPSSAQIVPMRIVLFDQRDLLAPNPALELLFTCNRSTHVSGRFEMHQPRYVVPARETADQVVFMLVNASHEVTRHTDVQRFRYARQDVDEVLLCTHRRLSLRIASRHCAGSITVILSGAKDLAAIRCDYAEMLHSVQHDR
jgi:hypothetical protein